MPIVELPRSGTLPTPCPIAIIRPLALEPFVLSAAFIELGSLYATPDPHRICVLGRFDRVVLVDTTNPDSQEILSFSPVGVASALDEQLLLIHDEASVTALGVDGILWTSGKVVADDLHIRRTDNGRIVCRGWDIRDGVEGAVEVTLDARTGEIIP
jgi:hypothetical protein